MPRQYPSMTSPTRYPSRHRADRPPHVASLHRRSHSADKCWTSRRARHARPLESPDGRPAHVMNERLRAACYVAGVRPRCPEILDALAVVVENERDDLAGHLQRFLICWLKVRFLPGSPILASLVLVSPGTHQARRDSPSAHRERARFLPGSPQNTRKTDCGRIAPSPPGRFDAHSDAHQARI